MVAFFNTDSRNQGNTNAFDFIIDTFSNMVKYFWS